MLISGHDSQGGDKLRFVLFADAGLPDLKILFAGIPDQGLGIRLSREANALACIVKILGNLSMPAGSLEEIGLLSHGKPGHLAIGNQFLTTSLLLKQAALLLTIGSWLHPSGRVRLMGCNVAAGPCGREFGSTMANLLGRTVVGATGMLGHGKAQFDAIFASGRYFTQS